MQLFRPRPSHWTEANAWRVWGGFGALFVVLTIVHVVRGDLFKWGVAARDYWPATRLWWSQAGDLYTAGIKGFLYLPQSIWLFTPFAYLPFGLGHALWRLAGLFLLALGLRQVAVRAEAKEGGALFFLATLLSLLCTFSATNTGQTNLHMVGCLLLACAALMDQRWGRSSLWLWVAMMAKPIALVPILLCGALQPKMRKSLLIGAVCFAALPYLHWDWGFVTEQYSLAFEKMQRAGQPGEKVYANLVWLIQSLGVTVPQTVRTAMQLGFALATLAACGIAFRRGGLRQGAWFLFAFAATYMMLLSPRTEANTYVVLVPFVALAAALVFVLARDRRAFFLLALAALALASDNYGRAFHGWTTPWLKPLVGLCFGMWLLWRLHQLPGRSLFAAPAEEGDPSRPAPGLSP